MDGLGDFFGDEEEFDGGDTTEDDCTTPHHLRSLPAVPAEQRNRSGLCGLDNQGATCYMNSLLQVLYMTPELRRGLYELAPHELGLPIPGEPPPTIQPREIAIALQRLFSRLQCDDVSSTGTEELTSAFGWTGAQTSEQQDLQELKNVLMDVLKDSLSGTSASDLLPEIFEGVFRNLIVCEAEGALPSGSVTKELPDEVFTDVFVQVRGQASLEQALRTRVTFEDLSGPNQYHCEELGRKVDAQKGATFKQLPPVLSFTLLRFEMDWAAEPPMRCKLTDEMSFPLSIDMQPYTEALRADGSKLSAGVTAVDVTPTPPTECWYDLFGVVVHTGGAFGGHYYAYARDVTRCAQGTARPTPGPTAAGPVAAGLGGARV